MTAIITIAVTLLAVVFAKPLLYLFTNDTEVVEIGIHYLYIVSPFYLLFSSMFVLMGVLGGAGDTIMPMVFTIISLWIVRVRGLLIFLKQLGLTAFGGEYQWHGQ